MIALMSFVCTDPLQGGPHQETVHCRTATVLLAKHVIGDDGFYAAVTRSGLEVRFVWMFR